LLPELHLGYEFPPCRAARPRRRRDCSGLVGLRRTGGRLISMGGARSKVDFKRKGLCGIPGGRRWSRRHDVYESVLVSDRQAWPSDVSGGFHASTVATGKASGKPGNEISNVVGYWRSSGSSPCGFGQVADNVSYSSTAQVTSGAHRNGHLNPCDRGAPRPRWLLRGKPLPRSHRCIGDAVGCAAWRERASYSSRRTLRGRTFQVSWPRFR
jgi:hypothetical protein